MGDVNDDFLEGYVALLGVGYVKLPSDVNNMSPYCTLW